MPCAGRKLYVIRKTAFSADQSYRAPSTQQKVFTAAQHEQPHRGLQRACCWRHQVGEVLPGPQPTERCVSAIRPGAQALSTNTFPRPLATYRYVAHSGGQHRAQQLQLDAGAQGRDESTRPCWARTENSYPISFAGRSDTATFDNLPGLLTMATARSARP